MHNQSLQFISLPDLPLKHQAKSDIPRTSVHTSQTTDENSTPAENIHQNSILELGCLADFLEKDASQESAEEAEALPKIVRAPSKKKTVLRQGSGDTTNDLEQLAISIPENTPDISQEIRKKFIKKVLLILLLQILITSLMVGMVFIPNGSFRNGVQNQPIIAIVTVILSLACFFVLVLKRSAMKKVPWNYILLFVFTCSSAYNLAFLASFTGSTIVLISAIFTLVIIVGATAFALFSKNKSSKFGYLLGQILPLGIALIIAGIVFKNHIVQVAISAGIVFIFSLYLTYDIQRLTGNFETKYTVDDYILAALDIYIDIYVIFVEVMKLFQNLVKD